MTAIVFAMLVLVTAVSWWLARRGREHRPFAVLLSMGVGIDLAQIAFDAGVLAPLRASLGTTSPWTGAARLAGVASDGIALLWPATLAGAALVVFAGVRAWPAMVGWAGAVAFLAGLHPNAGAGGQDQALAAGQVAGVVAAGAIIVTSLVRHPRVHLDAGQLPLVLVIVTEGVSLLGAWRLGVTTHWLMTQTLYLVLFAILILTNGRLLWRLRASR